MDGVVGWRRYHCQFPGICEYYMTKDAMKLRHQASVLSLSLLLSLSLVLSLSLSLSLSLLLSLSLRTVYPGLSGGLVGPKQNHVYPHKRKAERISR